MQKLLKHNIQLRNIIVHFNIYSLIIIKYSLFIFKINSTVKISTILITFFSLIFSNIAINHFPHHRTQVILNPFIIAIDKAVSYFKTRTFYKRFSYLKTINQFIRLGFLNIKHQKMELLYERY